MIVFMVYTPFFFACKLIRTQSSSSTVSFIARLCFYSIIVSTAALALIAAIMQGFHHATVATLKGISPDLIIKPARSYLNANKTINVITKDFASHISATMPCNFYHVLLQHPTHFRDFSHVALVAAIDPVTIQKVMPFVFAPICKDHQHSTQALSENNIILGKILAEDLNVQCGDTITILYPEDTTEDTDQITFASAKARIVGLFHSGVAEWDSRGAFISFSFAHNLFNDAHLTQQLYLKLSPAASLPEVQQLLRQRLHLPVLSWYDVNPALVSALHLEKYAMFSILFLIMLIAGITIAALLCMQLTYHQQTIAVLATYGMSFRTITTIFIMYGMLVTLVATILGLTVATLLSYVIDHYHFITLPDVYYVSHVPAHMSWEVLAMVLILSLTVSAIASWHPTRKIRYLPLARILADV